MKLIRNKEPQSFMQHAKVVVRSHLATVASSHWVAGIISRALVGGMGGLGP